MTGQSTRSYREIAAGLCLAALAIVVMVAGNLVQPAGWLTPSQSETFFPSLTLTGLVLCGLLIAAGFVAAPDDNEDVAITRPLRMTGMGLIILGYTALLPIAGFALSTLALHVSVAVALGYRRWVAIAVFAVAIIGLCWLVFIVLMGIPLKP